MLRAAALGLLAGCFSLEARDCQLRCGPADECPAGLRCVSGMCRTDPGGGACGGGDAGGGGDGPIDSPPAPSSCGLATLLSDDFNDGVMGPYTVAAAGGAEAKEEGGRLRLALGTLADSSATVESALRYDLRGSAVYVQAASTPALDGTTASFGITYDLGQAAGFSLASGQLSCGTVIGGAGQTTAVPFDAQLHAWWRLREETGSLHCEVSLDGATWSEIFSTPMPASFDLGRVGFGVTGVAPLNAGAFEVDNLNGGGAPRGSYCPISSLLDDFGDDVPGRRWDVFTGTGCIVAETGGALVLTPSPTEATACGYVSSVGYDVTGDGVWARVPEVAGGTAITAFTLDDGAWLQDSLLIGATAGMLVVGAYRGGVLEGQVAAGYDAAAHAYWRIREESGTVIWETSPNATSWTAMSEGPAPSWLPRARVRLFTTNAGGMATGQARFDEVRGSVAP